MRKFLSLLVFAMVGTTLHGATITYDAVIGCGSTCVTVSLSWADLALPVFTADVDDNFGDLLFALNVPSPAAKTGSILPNPQTAFGLPPSTIEIITNGAPAYVAEDLSVEPQQPTFADLLLLGVDGTVISDTRFVATFPTPEPAGWALAGAGLGLLLIGVGVFHRRNSDVSRG